MFTISKQIVDWNGDLYSVKRVLKETSIKEEFTQEYKEYLGADVVLKKNGMYYFVEKIDEAQIVEEEKLELDETTEV
jgi:hypothetical protein